MSYTFLPQYWGRGYTAEAVVAGLNWVADLVVDTRGNTLHASGERTLVAFGRHDWVSTR